MILHDGIPVAYNENFTIDKRNKSNLGHYECMAYNSNSFDKRSLFLIDLSVGREMHTVNMSWVIVIITGASSLIVGILFTSILIFCCIKFTKDKNYIYDDVVMRSAQVGQSSGSIIDRDISSSPGTEGVQHNGRVVLDYVVVLDTSDHVGSYDNEAGYEELSCDRDTDENRYQSLVI
jgi:hypothetical protein